VDKQYAHIDKDVLRDNFMTKADKEIEFADVPERLNLHMRNQRRDLLKGVALTQEELEEEAAWIQARAFQPKYVAHGAVVPDMTTIAAVLRFALVEKEDVPQICRYRKESLGNGVSEHQAWKILAWDLRWDHFSYRHKKLMSDADKLGDDLDDEYKQVRAFSRSHPSGFKSC